MPSINNWLGASQADAIGSLIPIKPTSIIVLRGATTLAAQTVRLETLSGDRAIQGEGGVTHSIHAMALGYLNHSSIANTDLRAGDRFFAGGVHYEVIMVTPAMIDNLTAYLRVRS